MRPIALDLPLIPTVLATVLAIGVAGPASGQNSVSLRILDTATSAQEVRLVVVAEGLDSEPWHAEFLAWFRWNPQHLRLVSADRHSEVPGGLTLTREADDDSVGFVYHRTCDFACAAAMSPRSCQPLAVLVFEVVGEFLDTDVVLLPEYAIAPTPPAETVLIDASWERVIPDLVDGRVTSAPFVRGDVDQNGDHDLSDAVTILRYLFGGDEGAAAEAITCPDVADVDDDAQVNVSDAVSLLLYLFLGGDPPPPPFDEPGLDPTADELDCSGERPDCL